MKMKTLERVARHARITMRNYERLPSPPFLVLFINSICNMKCDHCFYWRNLNQRDDLSTEEIVALSRSLGRIENLNLSGGEPFIRKDFAQICRQFITHNGVRQIYVPTNGWFTDKTVKQIALCLEEPDLDLFVAELSLDGTPEFHDAFRVAPGAFEHAMRTYDALAKMQEQDPRLRIHSISTATNKNLDEIRRLTTLLYERCPRMDHHNLAVIRGDRKDPSLLAPATGDYQALYDYIRRLWAPREVGRYGGIVEPLLQWAKVRTMQERRQVVPCRAGRISAVVYANGDVSVCELHKPLGNLRERTFPEIWNSEEAWRLRESIARKDCHCTTEVFLWSSVVYQPTQLARAMVGAQVWKRTEPLTPEERIALDAVPAADTGNGGGDRHEGAAGGAGPELITIRPASGKANGG